jgi:NAD(P)-dependent dehydrogenase (short-subunit alcohol dehydrogenase family)
MMGSMTDNTSGGAYIYRSSKAALNAVMKSLAVDLRDKGISVAVLHPGWVRTDMGGSGGKIEAFESVAGMRQVIEAMTVENTGRFMNYDGTEAPW